MLYKNWTHTATADAFETVIPDGCRDILIIEERDKKPSLVLTDWDYGARTVRLSQGKKLTGFRLRPGVSVDPRAIQSVEPSAKAVAQFIRSEANPDSAACELVDALTGLQLTTQDAAQQIGVHPRTLQRRLRSLGLPAPDYWRMLSRVRAAASALSCQIPLVEIANTNGFSDQSHMNREFIRWFGVSPAQMRRSTTLIDEVSQPGLGNWTVEQISIR